MMDVRYYVHKSRKKNIYGEARGMVKMEAS